MAKDSMLKSFSDARNFADSVNRIWEGDNSDSHQKARDRAYDLIAAMKVDGTEEQFIKDFKKKLRFWV